MPRYAGFCSGLLRTDKASRACDRLEIIDRITPLEIQLQCNLHLPRRSSPIRPPDSRRNQSKCSHIADLVAQAGDGMVARIDKIWVVEDVEALKAELRLEAFRDLNILGKYQVKVHEPRYKELVTPYAASPPGDRRILKGVGVVKKSPVAPVNSGVIVLAQRERISHQITP